LVRPEASTLPGQPAYNLGIAKLFNVTTAQTITATTLKTAPLAATRVTSTVSGTGVSQPLPPEKAQIAGDGSCHSRSPFKALLNHHAHERKV
jgi:hypothetical protein